eukprot:CAMPEP_0196137876 /NCGR_PEP_ID=MMETSP0910-20130528/5712_1 /TAXON_ID=49265 /ORGANISM="Thalassiosira rotula, Strain GSO102" /LENGTH=481 /DNA_ID=CAMNT_0041398397 /DNA_START=384 /DNA_END=1829 /DNA_ORIENTATION=+
MTSVTEEDDHDHDVHSTNEVATTTKADNNALPSPPSSSCPAIAACVRISNCHLRPNQNQWTGIIQNIVRGLTADELKKLRLVGSKEMQHLDLADPSLTCHLPLRMDRASFFKAGNGNGHGACRMPNDRVRKWLADRRRLVIDNDVDNTATNTKICPTRVANLIHDGYLNSVSELVIFDCHDHRNIIAELAQLPNLDSLRLADHEDSEEERLEELESIMACVGRMPTSLKFLDVEFDCTVHGSRLSFLERLHELTHLRLRGFDLSDGINYMRGCRSLTSLHLCHGNFYSSPSNDVNEKDLLNLMGLTKLRHVHLEGFDALSKIGLAPFCTSSSCVERLVLKHCQEMSEECLQSLGRMVHLESLHIVHSAYDDTVLFGMKSLRHLNALSSLKSLSLFYVLGNEDLSNLRVLRDLDSLETLNIAVEDEIDSEGLDLLCNSVLLGFASLRKLRIFSEDGPRQTHHKGKLEVEYSTFNFGDLVDLE